MSILSSILFLIFSLHVKGTHADTVKNNQAAMKIVSSMEEKDYAD